MKSIEDLVLENIEIERTAMKFKKGLHLAKKFIDSHVGDPDINSEMAANYRDYIHYLEENDLRGI